MADRTGFPVRAVLDGVPRIHFYEGGPLCPEDICFPSALKTVLQYLGDPVGCKQTDPATHGLAACGYSYLVGVTGEAFALSWAPDWRFTSAIHDIAAAEDDAPYRRAMEALGYGCEVVRHRIGAQTVLFHDQIAASIADKGRPVIAFGVVGPPEAAIITGYDEDGDVLIGWSYFQAMPEFATGLEFEPSGYFRKRNWISETESLLIIGDKQTEPKQSDVVQRALRWNVELARRPQVNGVANGLAAYDAWAAAIAQDDAFPAGDEATLRMRHQRHEMNVGAVAENRWYGGQFLIEAADHVHYAAIEDLYTAAARLAGAHDLMWKVWDACGGNGHPDAWKRFAEPAVRREIVPLILAARDKDADAVAHIEHALSLLVR